MVVRDPFMRLVSIFRTRFHSNQNISYETFQNRYIKEVEKYRMEGKKEETVESGYNVTFGSFVRFLTNNPEERNAAWDPIFDMCHPCYIRLAHKSYFQYPVSCITSLKI